MRSEGNIAVGNVVLQIDLPSGAGVSAATAFAEGGSCSIAGLQVRCSLGSLAPGSVRDVQLSLFAAAAGTSRATLRLTADNDALADNNTASMQLQVTDGADVTVAVTADPATLAVGGTTTATITAAESRPRCRDRCALVAITLPAGLTLTGVIRQRHRLHAVRRRRELHAADARGRTGRRRGADTARRHGGQPLARVRACSCGTLRSRSRPTTRPGW